MRPLFIPYVTTLSFLHVQWSLLIVLVHVTTRVLSVILTTTPDVTLPTVPAPSGDAMPEMALHPPGTQVAHTVTVNYASASGIGLLLVYFQAEINLLVDGLTHGVKCTTLAPLHSIVPIIIHQIQSTRMSSQRNCRKNLCRYLLLAPFWHPRFRTFSHLRLRWLKFTNFLALQVFLSTNPYRKTSTLFLMKPSIMGSVYSVCLVMVRW